MASQCPDLSDPNSYWSFCPNIAAAYLYTVLFGITMIAHIVQAILYKKPYCWVIVMSALLQTAGFISRVLSIRSPADFGEYATWFVLILIAPLFTNAFTYMVMGRMIWNYVADARIYCLTAWRFSSLFVVLDISALVIQIYGAATATGSTETQKQVLQGLHIYMVGVGIQQGFILLFGFFAIRFHRTLLAQSREGGTVDRQAWILLYALYATLTLITARIIFRLCEYSQGLTSNIPNHEAYQYCLDSTPMLLALYLLNIVHPGRIMAGKDGNIPGSKERKQMKGACNKFEKQALEHTAQSV